MNSKLIVNGIELDLSENIAVPLNLSISDVKEPEKRKRSYSKSIKLEGTSNNMQFFMSAYSLSMDILQSSNVSFNPAIRNPCEFYKNDLLIFKGKLKLNEVIIQDKNYYFDCTLFSDAVDIFAKLKEKKLNELDWSEYDHTLTRDNVVNTWMQGVHVNGVFTRNFGADSYGYQPQSFGYIYPIVDYGYNKPSTSTFRTNQLYPFVYVKEAIKKILNEALEGENIEVDYSTSFFTSANMQKLIYGFGGGDVMKLNSTYSNDMKVEADGDILSQTITGYPRYYTDLNGNKQFKHFEFNSAYNIFKDISFTAPPTQNINYINTTTGTLTINASGIYDINLSGNLIYTHAGINSAGSYEVEIYVDGVLTRTTRRTMTNGTLCSISLNPNLNLKAGQKLTFNILFFLNKKDGSIITVDVNDIHLTLTARDTIVDGSPITLNNSLPDIKCSEFLKGIMNLFYAYMSDPIYNVVTNKSTIYIDTFNNYYKAPSNYDDWTDKVDYQREITIQSNSLVQGSNYIYKFSEEKDFLNNEYKRLTGLNYGEKSIQLSTWATGDVKIELPFNTYVPYKVENTNLIYSKIIDQSIDTTGKETIKPYKGKGMLTFYNGFRTEPITIRNTNDDTQTTYTVYPFTHHIRYRENQNFDPLFDLHFASRNYTFDGLQVIPDQKNTYDYYHARFVNEMTSENSKLLSLYLKLNYKDIHDLDFSKLKMIDGILYRLNTIKDFDLDAYGTTQVELLKYLG